MVFINWAVNSAQLKYYCDFFFLSDISSRPEDNTFLLEILKIWLKHKVCIVTWKI